MGGLRATPGGVRGARDQHGRLAAARPGERAAGSRFAPRPVPHAPAATWPRGPGAADPQLLALLRRRRARLPHQRQARTGGVGSHFVHEHVHRGDLIDTAAPRGSFVLRDGERAIVLLSAGIGATPVLAMLQALGARPAASARSGGCTGPATARSTSSLTRSTRCSPSSRTPIGSSPTAARCRATSRDRHSTPSAGSASTRSPARTSQRTPSTTCAGPTRSCERSPPRSPPAASCPSASRRRPSAPPRRSSPASCAGDHHEPHLPPGAPGPGPAVTFARSNLTVAWDPSYGSLLELAEACEVPASFSCRTGVCHYLRDRPGQRRRRPTRPTRWNRPGRAASSSAARSRRRR